MTANVVDEALVALHTREEGSVQSARRGARSDTGEERLPLTMLSLDCIVMARQAKRAGVRGRGMKNLSSPPFIGTRAPLQRKQQTNHHQRERPNNVRTKRLSQPPRSWREDVNMSTPSEATGIKTGIQRYFNHCTPASGAFCRRLCFVSCLHDNCL